MIVGGELCISHVPGTFRRAAVPQMARRNCRTL